MEDYKFKFSDLIIIIPLGGVFFYSIGWNYWTNFYRNLNIDVSFIDLSIDRVIATTWVFNILFISLTIYYLWTFYQVDRKLPVNKFTRYFFIFILILIPFSSSYENSTREELTKLIIFIGCLLGLVGVQTFLFWSVNLRFGNKALIYLFVISIYITSFFHYKQRANRDATNFINTYKENVILTTKERTNVSGKFIGLMKNNYFILVKNRGSFEVVSINETEVYQVKYLDKFLFRKPLNR
jgi:hypothetical protein